ncbi:MAG TPA: metal ABC transporter permease [Rubrivivax sp.]|nr:metal ABC transporter permease [Rubrivivax sp.]
MTVHELLLQPFAEFAFMRRALVACLALGLSCGPLGTLLVLRRMSLMGDAMSHALLPGAAVAFIVVGLSLPAMSVGAFVAALAVAALAGGVARWTAQREDASFAAFYLMALATGVMLISLYGNSVDLMRVLFGSVLAVDDAALLLVAGVSTATLLALAIVYRPLLVECFDPGFLRAVGGRGAWHHQIFLVLVVANLVAGFQALGTLMAVGLLMLPAIAARFWVHDVGRLSALAGVLAAVSGYVGLLLSYHAALPSGPSIVMVAGAFYLVSLCVGTRDSLRSRFAQRLHHRTA